MLCQIRLKVKWLVKRISDLKDANNANEVQENVVTVSGGSWNQIGSVLYRESILDMAEI